MAPAQRATHIGLFLRSIQQGGRDRWSEPCSPSPQSSTFSIAYSPAPSSRAGDKERRVASGHQQDGSYCTPTADAKPAVPRVGSCPSGY